MVIVGMYNINSYISLWMDEHPHIQGSHQKITVYLSPLAFDFVSQISVTVCQLAELMCVIDVSLVL